LRVIPGWSALSDRDLSWLGARFDDVEVDAGTVLARQGVVAHELVVIVSGRAVVSVDDAPRGVVGPGRLVGELALLENGPHRATVTTETPTRVLVAGPESLGAVLDHPHVLRQVAATLADDLARVGAIAPAARRDNVVALLGSSVGPRR
jgi:CRP-like cAMP-binding protein